MKLSRVGLPVVVALFGASWMSAATQQLTPAWVELGEDGQAIARVIVATNAVCPSILIDATMQPMQERLPVPAGLMPACELAIPASAKIARIGSQSLILPKPDPARMVVFGDTGCRIKGEEIQNCNNPAEWPFERVAVRAAGTKPDLVIHVGDYLYREEKCPEEKRSFCGGTPAGDNWDAWKADFFQPAAKLLAAAPWVLARGNHESCARSWQGWFYYLDPHPWHADRCEAFTPPYPVRLGSFELIVFDSAAVTQTMSEKQIGRYASELESMHASHAWLVVHHPFWGFSTGGASLAPASAGLEEAWLKAKPRGIDLVVSGHVHLFELLSFDKDVPPQLVAGHGGTDLANPVDTALIGKTMGDATVVAGTSEHQFGYTTVRREAGGWRIDLISAGNRPLESCFVHGRQTGCQQNER